MMYAREIVETDLHGRNQVSAPRRTRLRVCRTRLAVNPGPHRTVLGCDGRAYRMRP